MSSRLARALETLHLLTPGHPVPSGEDVERYKRLRNAGRRLNRRLTATIPRRAIYDIGGALGILRGKTLLFDSEDMCDVLMDCCLYDWFTEGRNLIQTYAEERTPPADPDERDALDAMLRARYTILGTERAVRGRGVAALDLLTHESLFVIDMGLSVSVGLRRKAFAARILPIRAASGPSAEVTRRGGEFWMTSGAALPMTRRTCAAAVRNLARRGVPDDTRPEDAFKDPKEILAVVRSCIEGGAADAVHFAELEATERMLQPARERPPSRNATCPCGSGKKYKRCCGTGERRRRRSA